MNTTTDIRTRIARGVAMLLALLVVALGLTSCGKEAEEGPTAEQCNKLFGYTIADDAPTGVFVVDASRSRPNDRLSAAAAASIRALSESKGSITVLLVDGQGAAPQKVLERVSLNRADAGADTGVYKTAVTRSVPCIERALSGAVPAAPGTDLGEAIRAAAEYGATAGATTYVIDTDGFSNTGALNLVGQVNEVSVDEMLSRLDAAGWNPRFDGAAVTISGVARAYDTVVAAPHAEWLRSFYRAICVRSGAASCDVPVVDQAIPAAGESERSSSPEDPGLDFGELTTQPTDTGTVVTVPGSLLFAPDSAELSTDADETLAQVVQCVEAGAQVSLRGHTAHDATATAEAELELSVMRANAAKDRIVSLAGGGADRVTTQGFGDTQPVPGGQPADNRRVEFVIEGGC